MKTPSVIFLKKPIFCKFWEFLLLQSLSTANYLRSTFSGLPEKINILFRKSHLLFFKITKFSTFREKLLFQSHSTPTFLPLATFKKNHFFSWKTLCFFFKKTQTLHVLRNFTISVAFYGKFSTFNFKRFWKISIFCVKEPIYFCLKKNLHVLRISISSVAFNIKISTSKF